MKDNATPRDSRKSLTLSEHSYSGSMRKLPKYYGDWEMADEWNDWRPNTWRGMGNFWSQSYWPQRDDGAPKSPRRRRLKLRRPNRPRSSLGRDARVLVPQIS